MYGIVKQSSGYITVDSRVGSGTTFTVYLPRGEGQPQPATAQSAVRSVSGQETILLVEDEPSVGSLIRKVLEARGYRILQAHDSMNAFEIGEAHPGRIDLLISDVIMSGLNGPELAARLKRRRPAMKVLYISGFVDHTAVDLANLSENGMFMQKPFTPDALAARIRQQLDSTTGPNG